MKLSNKGITMAVVHQHFPEGSSDGFERGDSEGNAAVIQLHPFNEGVFDLEQRDLPTFPGIGVESAPVTRRMDLDTIHNRYFERLVTLSDGTKFKDMVGVSNHPVTDVLQTKVPAWWTDPFSGFNQIGTEKIGALGKHTYTKGIPFNRMHSLYRNAWDVHVALDSVAEDFGDEVQAEIVDIEGESNGAMTGTGEIAYAEEFGRSVNDAFLDDPCIVRKIGSLDLRRLIKHPEYPAREIFCLIKQAARIIRDEEADARRYVDTFEFSPEFVISNLLLTRSLFWGELGHLLAHVPDNQQGHYRLYEFSIGNQKRTFIEILRGALGNARQGMTHEVVPGTHMSIANPRTMEAKVDYFATRL